MLRDNPVGVLLTDGEYEETRLGGMIRKVRALVGDRLNVYRLDELIKGGCQGCLKCGPDNRCAWGSLEKLVRPELLAYPPSQFPGEADHLDGIGPPFPRAKPAGDPPQLYGNPGSPAGRNHNR